MPSILTKIVNDNGQEPFGEFKGIILGILETYHYEEVLLQTTNRILNIDTWKAVRRLIGSRTRPVRMYGTARAGLECARNFETRAVVMLS